MKITKIAVIGAGSWGTAIAKLLSDKKESHEVLGKQFPEVYLWGHRSTHVGEILKQRENTKYLSGFKLSRHLTISADLKKVVSGAGLIIMVVPSHGYREVFSKIIPDLNKNSLIFSATKGIENKSLLTMTEVMKELLPDTHDCGLGVLAGPSFAREVAGEIPTAVTLGSAQQTNAAIVQSLMSTAKFRVYVSCDIPGLELGGALKNIIAIAAGICDGLGFGTNTRAALITRGLAEITRLGVKQGANPLTFAGLGGIGDLLLTCTGDLSRNRLVGLKLGRGQEIEEIISEMNMVAEGVKTTKSAWNLAGKNNVEMPILEQIYQVLYENKPCIKAVESLLARDIREELEF
jgi:glycerol-3-phosphate dehydrogenase (NAD(P)+)